jgi:hypothetical protein
MDLTPDDGRRVKGVNLIGLVKAFKVYRRTHPLDGVSPETLALLDERILVSSWYPLKQHLELLELAYRLLMAESPKAALDMGLAGGREIWTSAHRGVVAERKVSSALRAMGPAWATYFNFGWLEVEQLETRTARFTVRGYPDVPLVHGMTIAGWHLAAAHVAGATSATAEVVVRPWRGEGPDQVHLLHL